MDCDSCSSSVTFSPSPPFSQTSVTLSNIRLGASYKLRVYATNGVSSLARINHRNHADNYAEVIVSGDDAQLGNSAHLVTNVQIKKAHSGSPNAVVLSWRPPTDPTLDVDVYEV